MNITIGIKASPRELDLEVNLSEDEFFAQAISFVRVTAQQSHRVGCAIH